MRSVFADGRAVALVAVAVAVAATPADAMVERAPHARADRTITVAERAEIGASIAFVREDGERREAFVAGAAGDAEHPLDAGPWQSYPAAVAPDGAIAILRTVDEGERHEEALVLRERDGSISVLARAPQVRNPAFSPDGRAIAFESDRASFRDLYRVARGDGGGPSRLTDDPEGNYEPAWTADGRGLFFTSSRDGQASIYRMNADGTAAVRLTRSAGDDLAVRVSPDGQRIAFLSARDGVDRVYVMPAAGGDARPLRPVSAETEREHTWSPDGTRLAFVARAPGAKSRVLVWDAERNAVTPITDGRAVADMPAFSPDGRYLAYVSDEGGTPDVFVARADGTGAVRLMATPANRWLPLWIAGPRS